jgi:hypothetical protein
MEAPSKKSVCNGCPLKRDIQRKPTIISVSEIQIYTKEEALGCRRRQNINEKIVIKQDNFPIPKSTGGTADLV